MPYEALTDEELMTLLAATVARRRTGQDAGLVGEGMRTGTLHTAGSRDQRVEERGAAAYEGTFISAPLTKGQRVAILRRQLKQLCGVSNDRPTGSFARAVAEAAAA